MKDEMIKVWNAIMAGTNAYAIDNNNTKFNIFVEGETYCGTIKEDSIIIKKPVKGVDK